MLPELPEPAPRDIVQPTRLTLEDLTEMNRLAAGEVVTITEPPEVLLDPDGWPIGVGEATEREGIFTGATIHAADVAHIRHPRFPDGFSADDLRTFYPHLHFYDPTEEQS